MSAKTPLFASARRRRQLADAFLESHDGDLESVDTSDLNGSGNGIDQLVFDLLGGEPRWREKILAWSRAETLAQQRAGSPPPREFTDAAVEKRTPVKKETTDAITDSSRDWGFRFCVNYLLASIPVLHFRKTDDRNPVAEVRIQNRALAVIDGQLTAQSDVLASKSAPAEVGIPRADVVSGYFDIENPKQLVLKQENDIVTLDEMNLSSVNAYRTIYTEDVVGYTRSRACDLLSIEGKQQVVTVVLTDAQIGIVVYWFENGRKVEWARSSMFDHGTTGSHVFSFEVAVSPEPHNGTVEVVAIVTKSDGGAGPSLQTNLIRAVIDVSSKGFEFSVNRSLASFEMGEDAGLGPLQQDVYQMDGFVCLNYFSATNQIRIATLRWKDGSVEEIWKEDHATVIPDYDWYGSPSGMLYRSDKTFYHVRVFQDGDFYGKGLPNFLDVYESRDDGSLNKIRSIEFGNEGVQAEGCYWGAIHAQGGLYLLQVVSEIRDFSDLEAPKMRFVYHRADDGKAEVERLTMTRPVSGVAMGRPIAATSLLDIQAGAPKVSSVTEGLQVVAVLDSPPVSHLIDYGDESRYPSLSYLFSKKDSTSKNVETKTDRSRSDSFSAGIKGFGVKIGGEISKKVDESTKELHQSVFTANQETQITCRFQDITVFVGMTFDVYEYPITASGKPGGHFLFLEPTSAPHLIVNTGQLAFRKSSHQVGNLLSYPVQKPDNAKQFLYTNEFAINADETFVTTVGYSDLKTTSETTTATTTVEKSASIGVEFPIIKSVTANIGAKLKGSYSESEISVSSFTIEDAFQLKIQIEKLIRSQANKNFTIEPYFYIDDADVLRCSYRVDVPTGGSGDPSFWKEHYKYPDFGMVMPFRFEGFEDDSKYLLSFDIETCPQHLERDLKELEISATIHNWSLVSGSDVEVGFYYAEELKKKPTKEDLVEIGRQLIDVIEPRQSRVASITWKNPKLIDAINAVPIYVIVDPDGRIQEMSKDHNCAQMNYPIDSLTAEAPD